MEGFNRIPQFPLLLLFALLASYLVSCAAIMKGSESAVRVEASPETRVYNDAGEELEHNYLEGEGFEILLPCDRDHELTFRVGDREVQAKVQSKFQPAWILPDMVLGFPLVVDFLSQSWYDFTNVKLLIPPDDLNYAVLPPRPYRQELSEDQQRLWAWLKDNDSRSNELGLFLAGTGGWVVGVLSPALLTADTFFDNGNGDKVLIVGLFVTGPILCSSFISAIDSGADSKGDFSAAFGGAFVGLLSSLAIGILAQELLPSDLKDLVTTGSILFIPPLMATISFVSSRPKTVLLWNDSSSYGDNARYTTLEGMQRSSLLFNFGDDAPGADGFRLPLLNIKL